jgi:hypothetical protein
MFQEVSITLPPVMLDMVTLLVLWVIFLMVQTQSYLVLVLAAYTEYWKIWIDYNQNGTLKLLKK